jgi:hypothetical protein
VSPVKYELGFYIPEDDILHSHCRENLKYYIALTGWTQWWRNNVSPVRHELGFYIPEDDILHSYRRDLSGLEIRSPGSSSLYFPSMTAP